MVEQKGEFWWKNITGPQTFVRQVTDALGEERLPVLRIPADLPWRHDMRNTILEQLHEMLPDRKFYCRIIDAADECPDSDIGDFLLKAFSDEDIACSYRPRSGKSIQQYLIEHAVLANRLLWIKGLSPEQELQWIEFCRGFSSHGPSSGMFIIESRSSGVTPLFTDVEVIEFERVVSRYDVLLFNNILLAESEMPLSKLWKSYVATAAACLCDYDAELSSSFIEDGHWKERDPREILRHMSDWPEFSLRGSGDGASHILALLRHGDDVELMRRLWTAQIQMLFPLIELQRGWLIDKLSGKLRVILQDMIFEQFGQRVRDPKELELGSLVWLLSQKDIYGERLLYVPDEWMREAIYNLRECRNTLAHRHQCCTPDQVAFVLNFEEKRLAMDNAWSRL